MGKRRQARHVGHMGALLGPALARLSRAVTPHMFKRLAQLRKRLRVFHHSFADYPIS